MNFQHLSLTVNSNEIFSTRYFTLITLNGTEFLQQAKTPSCLLPDGWSSLRKSHACIF